ncbi:hypothetical protein P170DRAFT_129596 [Aspergillus steynii IBT 23096]|uniref:Uncharacterized protein n=1 Tax=Aspergillus steynii IBT 23096 TaxID=1392250 RepID=A0A2I2GKJ7_9EURO|nr:uncharacterized protein P170DRAFT_129596 [Aspergillus steynii IBT 23096]PLB53406.1 hypothetical protein P170DRAFT_129596 [Aspergillus steynii IBT 23096]
MCLRVIHPLAATSGPADGYPLGFIGRETQTTPPPVAPPSPPCLAGSNHRARRQSRLQQNARPAHAWTLLGRPGPPRLISRRPLRKTLKGRPFPSGSRPSRSLQLISPSQSETEPILRHQDTQICLHPASISFHHPSTLPPSTPLVARFVTVKSAAPLDHYPVCYYLPSSTYY